MCSSDLVFDQREGESSGGRSSSQQMVSGQLVTLGPHLRSHTEIHSQWVLDLNVKCKTVDLLGESTEGNVHDLALGKELLDMGS